jgi:asparagine synthase (glutamine-hydrolysing)
MCGFAGAASAAPCGQSHRERAEVLQAMGRQLSRRGPDDEQLLIEDHLGLVFRRLSIVDCAGGRQPIANEDGTISVAINGEIYNHQELRRTLRREHRFRTHSDAEVVVHLYEERGAEALDSLIGMFAIAIWDAVHQVLFLARDRLGIKPLYYSRQGSDLLFGSEVKALLAHPACSREFNWRDWTPDPGRLPTFVTGVDCLPAGHYLLWNSHGEIATHCYWNLDEAFATSDTGLPAEHYVERFADLFEDSVSLRLMADVPVGAFLSGGLDSAAMVAVAAQHGQVLPCFTILEKTTLLCGDAQAAADVTALVEAPFYSVLFDHQTLADELRLGLGELEYFIWLMDYPLFTLEFLFKHELHRFAKTVIPDIKVILIGQGADEFAGGYSNGVNKPHASWDDYLAKTVVPLWKAHRRSELGVPDSFASVLSNEAHGATPDTPFLEEMKLRLRTLQTFNLWHEDRTSAGQGIEARVPYLDHRLVELLASVPRRLQHELFWDKEIIRRAARRWLPEALVRRHKVPFIYAPNRASTVDFMYRWVATIFPAFREKYLEGPRRLFDGAVLAGLLRLADKQPERKEQAVRQLTQCMAIGIFGRMCEEGPGDFSGSWRPPSPLQRRHPAEAPWAIERLPGAEVTAS